MIISPNQITQEISKETERFKRFTFSSYFYDKHLAHDSALKYWRKQVEIYEPTGLVEYDKPELDNTGWYVAGYPTQHYHEAERYAKLDIGWDSEKKLPAIMERIQTYNSRIPQLSLYAFAINISNVMEWKNHFDLIEIDILLNDLIEAQRLAEFDVKWDSVTRSPNHAVTQCNWKIPDGWIKTSILHERLDNITKCIAEFPQMGYEELYADYILLHMHWEEMGDSFCNNT